MKRYELLDHTADIGIRAFGRDLQEAFGNAAYAMFDIITYNEEIKEKQSFDIQITADHIEDLLITWLDELLFKYETERFLFKEFKIKDLSDTNLNATIFGEKVDLKKHEIKVEIKNVTYHQLKVEKTADGWELQVIFDL